MSVSRRSALSVLGLGAVATIAPEDFSAKAKPLLAGAEAYSFGVAGAMQGGTSREKDRARMTTALRRLADDIDVGGSFVQGMKLTSEVRLEDFLTHTLQVEFVVKEDIPPAA